MFVELTRVRKRCTCGTSSAHRVVDVVPGAVRLYEALGASVQQPEHRKGAGVVPGRYGDTIAALVLEVLHYRQAGNRRSTRTA